MDLSSAYSVLANIYANFSKKAGCFYVYSYTPVYDSSTKNTYKKNITSIGKISSESGIGFIEFNAKFLRAHPEFINLKVFRKAKNTIHIESKENDSVSLSAADSSDLLEAHHMKIGASYFIVEALKKSFSGRALKALYDSRKISKTQYDILLTVLVYSIYEGVKHLGAIEYFIRDHIVPFNGNINKDSIQRLYAVLDSQLIIDFYKKKQEIMQAEFLSKKENGLNNRKFIALDGSNIDISSRRINCADYGKAKSGNETPIINFLSLIDQTTGTLLGHCTYSGHTTDIATLEGSVKQLSYYGCKNYTLIVDRGYWSVYNLSVIYNFGIDVIAHVKTSQSTAIRKFINSVVDDMSVGNGCVKIEQNGEVNYASRFKYSWNYYDIKAQKKVNKPIYLYAFYNPAIATSAKEQLISEVAELNSEYEEYKQKLANAIAKHKKKPEMPSLKNKHETLIDDGIIVLNKKYNRYDICNEKAYKYIQACGIWVLASTSEFDCEDIYTRYRQRNEIEVMYRYFKNHVDANTLNTSTEESFKAKLFIGLLASEFLNSLKLKTLEWNKTASDKQKVKLKDNSMYMTFKDLDTLECIRHGETIIPITNILKRHEALFNMMDIDPIVLQNTKLKKATLDDDMGLTVC